MAADSYGRLTGSQTPRLNPSVDHPKENEMPDCMHNSGLTREGDYLVCNACGARLYNPS